MTLDERALATVLGPAFDPHSDRMTHHVVEAFMKPWRGSVVSPPPEQAKPVRPGMASGLPSRIVRQSPAWEVMHRRADPKALTDREVMALVMGANDHETFTEADLKVQAEQVSERAGSMREQSKQKVRAKHSNEDRAKRAGKSVLTECLRGTAIIPDSELRHGVKVRRSKSLKAAIARRERRRVAGKVINHKSRDWACLTPQQQRQHRDERDALLRLDSVQAAFLSAKDDPDGKDIEHLAFLHRLGRA